jgi:hypothetical protein
MLGTGEPFHFFGRAAVHEDMENGQVTSDPSGNPAGEIKRIPCIVRAVDPDENPFDH